MPTILFIHGWRLFFYSNQGSEPIHVHAEMGDMECKFWLLLDEVEIREDFSYNLTPSEKKKSKKLELANDIQGNLYTISPSGYGIHWPLIDEDLSVDYLLKNI